VLEVKKKKKVASTWKKKNREEFEHYRNLLTQYEMATRGNLEQEALKK